MLNEENLSILVINSLGFLLTIIVIIVNLKTKNKDFSTYSITILISYDILMAFIGILSTFGINSTYCSVVIFFQQYARIFHVFLIFFIGFSLYSIIVKEKEISFKTIKVFLATSNVFSLAISSAFIILNLFKNIFGICVVDDTITDQMMIAYGIGIVLPSALTQGFIIYYYYNIRLKLKAETGIHNLKCNRNRIFAKRLIGYCVLFTFYSVPLLIVIIEREIVHATDDDRYFIETVALDLYPILNSLMYGLTKSSKRNLFNICIKDDNFEDQCDIINQMRQEGVLKPRFYLDLIDQSESKIFQALGS